MTGPWALVRSAPAAHRHGMAPRRTHPSSLTNDLVNPVLLALLRSRAGVVLGRHLAVVAYEGRRTGRRHALVAGYRLDGCTVRIRAGRPDGKQWWRNFETPHPVSLRLAGHDHATVAVVERDGAAVTVTAELAVRLSGTGSRR